MSRLEYGYRQKKGKKGGKSPKGKMRILGRKKLLRGERCQTQSSGEEGERVF